MSTLRSATRAATLERDDCTVQDVFDICIDALERIERVESAVADLTMLTLHHLDRFPAPSDPEAYESTIRQLERYLALWVESLTRNAADDAFLEAAE